VDTVRVVLACSAIWAAALIVLLLLGDRVDPQWVWTCVAALVLAGVGLGIMAWQGRLGTGDPARRQAGPQDPAGGGEPRPRHR
jgi:drug/metabolite transporter (DMT)-like permease